MKEPGLDPHTQTPLGRRIVSDSFATIDREVGEHGFPPDAWAIVRRVIHTTADFDFKSLTVFHPEAIARGIAAAHAACPIVVDVQMIRAGLSPERLAAFGCQAHCFISDSDVLAEAQRQDSTRAVTAMQKAHRLGVLEGAIVAIGNAPTALLEVLRLVEDQGAQPALVLGVPVGFISAAESKEALMAGSVPYIATRGRKGGSPVAVAIMHSLLALAAGEG